MKTRLQIGSIAAGACWFMPLLCRIPKGSDWVSQYLPEGIGGMIFFAIFAAIPSAIVFGAALISRARFYLPVVLSTLVALILLAYMHHGNDLTADAQAAISLVVIPIIVAAASAVAGLIGFGIQSLSKPARQVPASTGN